MPRTIRYPTEKDRLRIIADYHMTPSGGHIGQYRLYQKIREKYKWKNMKDDIKKYVRNCKACIVNKTTRHTKEDTVVTTTPTKLAK